MPLNCRMPDGVPGDWDSYTESCVQAACNGFNASNCREDSSVIAPVTASDSSLGAPILVVLVVIAVLLSVLVLKWHQFTRRGSH